MKYPYLLPFFFLLPLAVPAQSFPVGLEVEPEKPIVIENPARGKALLVFYPDKGARGKTNPVHLFEVDTRSLAMTQPGAQASLPIRRPNQVNLEPRLEMHFLGGSAEGLPLMFPNRHLNVVCSFARGNDYFFVLENNRDFRLMRVSGGDLSLQQTDGFRLPKGQWVVQGAANGPDAYILCAQKKGRRLTVYAVDGAGKLVPHQFREPARSATYFSDLFKKNIRPVAAAPGSELEPGLAAVSSKLYAVPGHLFMTHDVVVGSTPTYRSVALRVFDFDLEKNALSIQALRFTDSTYFMEDQAGASYLLDDRIFQVYLNPRLFALRVRDLSSGKVLYDQQVRPADAVDFASTPVLMPERGLKATAREYRSGAEFIEQFSKFVPFVQVRRAGENYLVQVGGYVEMGGSSLGYVEAPTGADPLLPGLYTRSFSFYVTLDGQTLQPVRADYPGTLSDAFRRLEAPAGAVKHRELHRLGDHFYQGYYDPSSREYALQRVPGY
jgi:hypothetical protein